MTKSSLLIWHYVASVKWTVKISSIFVAFLENTNFKKLATIENFWASFRNDFNPLCMSVHIFGGKNKYIFAPPCFVPHLRLIYILIIWPKLYSTFMTHQSVKQNDATQWVQRFYEVVFECFFKYKRSARFQNISLLVQNCPYKHAPHSLWQSCVLILAMVPSNLLSFLTMASFDFSCL